MDKGNLNKMADYIENIPQYKFDMRRFRTEEHADDIEIIPDDPQEKVDISAYLAGQKTAHECGTVGCPLGHCTILDERPLPLNYLGEIDFYAWSKEFTGLDPNSIGWCYLFGSFWTAVDNTPVGAAKRIRYLIENIENGAPEDWKAQMEGDAPLSYM